MASGRPVIQPGRPVNVGVSISQQRLTITSSPFLAAEELEKIEQIVPGGASRALALVENQSAHRIKQEDRVVRSNILNERLGQLIAAGIVGGGMLAGYNLLMADRSTAGLIAMLTPLGLIAGAFLVGKVKRDRELNSRDAHRG